MASTRSYRWRAGDTIWYIAARFLAESGYASTSEFVEAIRAANAGIIDWVSDPVAGTTLITVPYLTS